MLFRSQGSHPRVPVRILLILNRHRFEQSQSCDYQTLCCTPNHVGIYASDSGLLNIESQIFGPNNTCVMIRLNENANRRKEAVIAPFESKPVIGINVAINMESSKTKLRFIPMPFENLGKRRSEIINMPAMAIPGSIIQSKGECVPLQIGRASCRERVCGSV